VKFTKGLRGGLGTRVDRWGQLLWPQSTPVHGFFLAASFVPTWVLGLDEKARVLTHRVYGTSGCLPFLGRWLWSLCYGSTCMILPRLRKHQWSPRPQGKAVLAPFDGSMVVQQASKTCLLSITRLWGVGHCTTRCVIDVGKDGMQHAAPVRLTLDFAYPSGTRAKELHKSARIMVKNQL